MAGLVQIGGSAALGALTGGALAWIRYVADNPPRPVIHPLSEGLTRFLHGLIAAALVLLVAIPAGFAALGVGPLPVAAPLGVLVAVAAILACFLSVPGRLARLVMAVVVTLAAELALVAAADLTSRPWLIDLGLLALTAAVAWKAAPWIRYAVELRDTRADLARLPFQPMLPDVEGYEISDVFPIDSRLLIYAMDQDAPPDQRKYQHAFSVTVGAVSDEYLMTSLKVAQSEGKPAGRGRWVVSGTIVTQVFARYDDLIVDVQLNDPDRIPVEVLLRATELHPVSAATIMSMWRRASRPR